MIWYVIGSIPLILFIIYIVRDRISYNKKKKEGVYICKEETPLGAGWIIIGIVGLIMLGIFIEYVGSFLTGGVLYQVKGNTEEYSTSWNITAMQDNLNTHILQQLHKFAKFSLFHNPTSIFVINLFHYNLTVNLY